MKPGLYHTKISSVLSAMLVLLLKGLQACIDLALSDVVSIKMTKLVVAAYINF